MQLEPPAEITHADVYARKGELSRPGRKVTYPDIADASASLGQPYPVSRFEKVILGHDKSQPVLDAAWAALDVIAERHRVEDLQRRAADGDREAQDELDHMEADTASELVA